MVLKASLPSLANSVTLAPVFIFLLASAKPANLLVAIPNLAAIPGAVTSPANPPLKAVIPAKATSSAIKSAIIPIV